ncbi:MAG: thioesterase [Salinisphaeraceae bacterium]|nr:thioesterase [Salinisphaeraceae bacterium]
MTSSSYERIRAGLAAGDLDVLLRENPYPRFLGVEIKVLGGERYYVLPRRDELIGSRRLGAMHGGVLAGFLESASLFEVLITQQQYHVPSPVDFEIDYLRSARQPSACHVRCEVVRQGSRVAQVRAECWQNDRHKPVAASRAVFLLRNVDNAPAKDSHA